ncbi:hypothetical protein [Robbsia andropogonis]|uniref:hypothetical protein n=1 Tax=Robbsia andropogonis TaxID=28092 RepID=UPI002A698AD8|nr:hypothetical protein [Robbsia andropogonis]
MGPASRKFREVHMFGLYPAGQKWASFLDCRRDVILVARDLASIAGHMACLHHEPFGPGRGCLIAQSNHILVLTNSDSTQLAVVPSIDSQYLIWSFENGLKDQWSQQELTALVQAPDWDAFLHRLREQFVLVTEQVRQAVAGLLVRAQESSAQDEQASETSQSVCTLDLEAEAALWEANQQTSLFSDLGNAD